MLPLRMMTPQTVQSLGKKFYAAKWGKKIKMTYPLCLK